jgi:hypothetical protein
LDLIWSLRLRLQEGLEANSEHPGDLELPDPLWAVVVSCIKDVEEFLLKMLVLAVSSMNTGRARQGVEKAAECVLCFFFLRFFVLSRPASFHI